MDPSLFMLLQEAEQQLAWEAETDNYSELYVNAMSVTSLLHLHRELSKSWWKY